MPRKAYYSWLRAFKTIRMKLISILSLIISIGFCSYGQSDAYFLADSHFVSKQFDQAKSLYQRSLKQGKNKYYRGTIHFQIAECIRLDSDSISEFHYSQSIENLKREYSNLVEKTNLDPEGSKKIEILKKYGFCYYRLNNLEIAEAWFEKYLRIKPNDKEVHEVMLNIKKLKSKE